MSADVDISELVDKFPLKRWLLENYGVQQEGADEYLIDCPACGKPKLSVNVAKRRWRCFRCEVLSTTADGRHTAVEGAGGVWSLLRWMFPETSAAATVALLRSYYVKAGIGDVTSYDDLLTSIDARQKPSTRLPTGLPEGARALDFVHPYAQRRGITLEDASRFGLHYVATGWAANRIVFPVWWRGQCYYWQARACWDEHEHVPRDADDRFRKTLNPAQRRCAVHGKFPQDWWSCPSCGAPPYYGSGDVVLNLEQAVWAGRGRVAMCEGPTSAIRVGYDAIATFGKQLQATQIHAMRCAGVTAVDIMWDGPSPKEPLGAWMQAIQAAKLLSTYFEVRIVFFPSGDPGTYSREQNGAFRTGAIRYFPEMLQWRWQHPG